jgi:cell division septum initiation protein DivIVA
MTKISKATVNKFLRYSPIVLLIALVVYSFKTHESQNRLDDEFRKEKLILQQELDQIVADYKKMSVKKKGLSRRIITSINKIIALKDSIKEIKKGNYELLLKYSVKAAKLERENRALLQKADNLHQKNEKLQEENSAVKRKLRAHKKSQESLVKMNEQLEEEEKALKEKIGAVANVQIGNIAIFSYKERNNGKYTSTSRSNKTDAFKIKFDLLANELAEVGVRDILIQILDKENNVILSEKNTGEMNDSMPYNDFIKVNYENQKIGVVSLISVDRYQMQKGDYKVVVYIDDTKAGEGKISLR